MGEKEGILAEIHRLIDEQMAALQRSFPPDECLKYMDRKKRIDALLERISRDGFTTK
jgi:hypothetical protein